MSAQATAPAERVERVADHCAQRELDALLISAPLNVRYVSGFTGSAGVALVGAGPDGRRRFFTDFRYDAQAGEQLPQAYEREIVGGDLLQAAVMSLPATPDAGGRLGFDDAQLSVKAHAELRRHLPAGWELVPCGGLVEELREVKDAAEVQRITAAASLVDELLEWIAERGLAGRSERQVAVDLEHEMRLRGADGPSFPSIVASGVHGALPHAEPRDVPIGVGVLVTIDLGAHLDGYCSDCTRTFATGPIGGQELEVYELVLAAQEAALAAAAPGLSGRQLDAVAREIIEQAGYGERFGHGLGHGVGLEVHEGPRLSRRGGEALLREGQVLTIEPGVYLPGRLGVRIEDLVLLNAAGAERLSRYPKQLITVD